MAFLHSKSSVDNPQSILCVTSITTWNKNMIILSENSNNLDLYSLLRRFEHRFFTNHRINTNSLSLPFSLHHPPVKQFEDLLLKSDVTVDPVRESVDTREQVYKRLSLFKFPARGQDFER